MHKDVECVLELIQGHKAQDTTRSKRALISVMGKVSRYLFGTLDEASEAEIKNLIEGANNNTNRLSQVDCDTIIPPYYKIDGSWINLLPKPRRVEKILQLSNQEFQEIGNQKS